MPFDLPDVELCSFCEYLAGRSPYTILEHTALAALFVTYEQRGVPHVLALPARHRVTLLDLEEVEADAVMDATVRATRAIAAAYDPPGIAVWQNNGLPANQSVPHVHVHVAGTLPGGGTAWGDVPRSSLAETEAIAMRLAPHLEAPRIF
jgi:histidine triad (HIT) family protein